MDSNTEIANTLLAYFPEGFKGTMLEVGAAHPVNISLSKYFRTLGWNIISVEPIPEHCEEFRKLGLPILEYAAYSEDKGLTDFKVSPNFICCSALDIRLSGHYGWADEDFKTIQVQALTLNTILKKHYPEIKSIDVLTTDTEGYEFEVLSGFDLSKYRPKVVCLEYFHNCENYMKERGYKLGNQIFQDSFFLRIEEFKNEMI